jgi:alpha-beta hydrolase superfamily lysophospholipase
MKALRPSFGIAVRRAAAACAAMLLVLTLCACAPLVQQAGRPGAGFAGPRLDGDSFISFDGARLGLTRWTPQGEPWAVIVAVHGMNSYSRAFRYAGPAWARDGIAVYAYDHRGYGRSPGGGVWPGNALLTEDLRTFLTLVRARHPGVTLAVVANSMGAAAAIEAFASDRPPEADRLVLAAPAVSGWSSNRRGYTLAVWLLSHATPGARITPPDWLLNDLKASDNDEELADARADPLMTWAIRADSMRGMFDLADQAAQDLPKVRAPILYLYGAKDRIEPRGPTLRAAQGLKAGDRSAYYADGWHMLLADRQGPRVIADIEAFVRDPAAPLPSGAPPIPAADGSIR